MIRSVLIIILLIPLVSMANPLWMRYSAISPDGSQIVFSYKGDLFTVDSRGGKAIQLTNHEAHDFKPVWSNDGKFIFFASDRYGNFDLFRILSEGGNTMRLTYHSADEFPQSVTADNKLLFISRLEDDAHNIQFPYGLFSELYAVSVNGGAVTRILSTPAENATFSKDQTTLFYQDVKGYEDKWRKHHTSSVTRDIWKYNVASGTHTKITSFKGEDRNPVVDSSGNVLFYLSEQFGSFNVCKQDLNDPIERVQISNFDIHPVRFLSISNTNTLCYTHDGEIYTQKEGQEPRKVEIEISWDDKSNNTIYKRFKSGITEMDVSPNGKEIAMIIRGEIFVTSSDYKTTKRITNTPEQERSVSFSPDGKKIVYASERNGSWNIYQAMPQRSDEQFFSLSTVIQEVPLLETPDETFQPKYSPDGKEVAFLHERTTLRIIKLETREVRTVLDGKYNYSYSDGDQWFHWSPDSRWLLVEYLPHQRWVGEIGLVKATGDQDPVNLTNSGYNDRYPKWMMNGEMLIWFSDKMGYRSHGSWGSQYDIFAMFLTQDAFDKFHLSRQEYELQKELKEANKENSDHAKDKKERLGQEIKPIQIELNDIEDRIARLTLNASFISDAILTPDGEKLYYLSRFEKGYDLWMKDLKKNETKLLHKLKGYGSDLQFDQKTKNLFFISKGKMYKMNLDDNKKQLVKYSGEFELDQAEERAYIFEHAWRQVHKKFYDPDLHGVNWEFMKKEYEKFLPHINNNYDFSEMLSEMLGELNGSHTGCRYRPKSTYGDTTAVFGVFFDWNHTGKGMKIQEIIDKGPFVKAHSKAKGGVIIEKINEVPVEDNAHFFQLMNHKTHKKVLVSLFDPESGKRWEEVVQPISRREEYGLLYDRWVEWMNDETERISKGRIGYVHVRSMNSSSFREVYSELLGKHVDKEAVVVDTRFNGGGWLHDDLATLLSGKRYADFVPRGQLIGSEPQGKWYKPSVVLMGEGNYSDAHGFPYAYTSLDIGKLVGMPVPGTMTAVWWERQIDPTLVFGIPQVGVKDMEGEYLENKELKPDIQIAQDPAVVVKGKDEQLEKAIQVLLDQLNQ